MPYRQTRKRLTLSRLVLVLFIGLTCWKVWLGAPEVFPTATAQIPDSGLQRKQLIDEVRRTNQLLAQLNETIRTQTFKVRIEGTDNKPAAKVRARGR